MKIKSENKANAFLDKKKMFGNFSSSHDTTWPGVLGFSIYGVWRSL